MTGPSGLMELSTGDTLEYFADNVVYKKADGEAAQLLVKSFFGKGFLLKWETLTMGPTETHFERLYVFANGQHRYVHVGHAKYLGNCRMVLTEKSVFERAETNKIKITHYAER